MPSVATPGRNLWIASSDGDLDRVKELIENQGMSANDKDENTYTPMHAAASYGHLDLLEYLISKGGDINISDEDGDTPIFTVESVDVARWMVEHGAKVDVQNNEGQSPAEYLFEEHPETAVYLQSLLLGSEGAAENPNFRVLESVDAGGVPSEYQAEQITSQLSEDLMSQTNEIMERHERNGTDPEAELREIVSRAVLQGWQGALRGNQEQAETTELPMDGDSEEPGSKRARTD